MRFLLQFNAGLVYILIVAGAVSLVLGEYTDGAVIFGMVLTNALIGFIQEHRAIQAVGSLSRSLLSEATVRRGGARFRLTAADIVPGDVVILEPGDRVSADSRLLSCRDLHCDESMLTGESAPASKRADSLPADTVLADRRNMAYAGALVTRGHAEGLVVSTGSATEIGRISSLIAATELVETPLMRRISAFSRMLTWVILVIGAMVFVVGLFRGHSASEMFMAAVALAVSAIPEGLPSVVTIMLAIGVARMAGRRAIVRRLPAVEALGSTTVICSDKTGTLTQNQMTVRSVYAAGTEYDVTGSGYNPDGQISLAGQPVDAVRSPALLETLRCGALCNDTNMLLSKGRWEVHGDPTEGALLVSAQKARLSGELAPCLPSARRCDGSHPPSRAHSQGVADPFPPTRRPTPVDPSARGDPGAFLGGTTWCRQCGPDLTRGTRTAGLCERSRIRTGPPGPIVVEVVTGSTPESPRHPRPTEAAPGLRPGPTAQDNAARVTGAGRQPASPNANRLLREMGVTGLEPVTSAM